MRRGGWLLAAVGLACAGAGRAERVPVEGVVAYVNEHTVTAGEVEAAMEPVRKRIFGRYHGDERSEKMKAAYAEALDFVIERYLILDFHAAQKGHIADWVVDERIDEVLREQFKGDRTELMKALSEERLTFAHWRQELRDQYVVAVMRRARVSERVRIPASAARAAYRREPEKYRTPLEARIRLIVFKAKEGETREAVRKRADEVRGRVGAGEDFGTLARELSQGPKAADGGDWGWVEPGLLRSELSAALAGLAPGQISEVIAVDDESFIVKLEERRGGRAASFEDVHEEIENRLRRQESERVYRAWVSRLRENAYVALAGFKPRALEER
jgi:peptidyl-prolyl cis-trans isomerase SurA